MQASATWTGGYQTRLDDRRGHEVVIDLPRDEDGQDAGTSALELAVLSLAGCISTIFALVARRRRVAYSAMRVDLTADRPRGSPTVTGVQGTMTIATPSPQEEVETVLSITLRTCPVGVIFERARIPIQVTVVRAAEPPARSSPSVA